ncbi:MAG: hypothetical protein K9I85_13550 [Saprospiraceae bacterium]|nr:hypothetical protein [Saprospiraceae bacterium]
MPKSKRLSQLESRITFLERNILPTANPTGRYTKIEQDLIRSYVLLVHAEIEAYFEDIVREKVRKALINWSTYRKRSSCLKAVLAYAGNEISYENTPKTDSNNIAFRVNRAVSHFVALIQKNHGIKENNIISMLIPLGIEINEIDPVWLSTMEGFGTARGNIAHSSIRVASLIDRNTELHRINAQILPEIQRLDQLVSKLA